VVWEAVREAIDWTISPLRHRSKEVEAWVEDPVKARAVAVAAVKVAARVRVEGVVPSTKSPAAETRV
jgi:hypothetical protein